MQDLRWILDDWLGLAQEAHDLRGMQIGARAVIVYLIVLIIVRLGHKRFLSRSTPFDIILAILLGSVASRAITGNAPFFPPLLACGVLIAVHAVFAWTSFHWHAFGILVKGKPSVLIRDGTVVTKNMSRSHITEHDLAEALRVEASIDDPAAVRLAHLERSGEISVIAKSDRK